MIAEHKFSDAKKNLLEKYLIHSEEKVREQNELFNLRWSGLAQPEEPIWMYKIRPCRECVAESLQLDVEGHPTRALKQDFQNVSWDFKRPTHVS